MLEAKYPMMVESISLDLGAGYITKARAEACYGVVCDPGSTKININATISNLAKLRNEEREFEENALAGRCCR